MKILFLTNHLESNDGWSRYSVDIVKEIKNQGNQVLCLTNKKNSKQSQMEEINILGKPLNYLTNPLYSFFTSLKVEKIIKNFSPDIIHFLVEPYAYILPFMDIKGIKTFITIHGTYSFPPALSGNVLRKKISNYLTQKIYKKINGIISVSNYTKKHLLSYLPDTVLKIKVITNGIDLKKHKTINIYNKPENTTKQILFVGAIKQRKGIIEAIEVLNLYKNKFLTDFFYNIIGYYDKRDPYYKKIVQKLKEYRLEDNVALRGKISEKELADFYKRADLFLMLPINDRKTFEGFGLVYLEANARGIPCIGTQGCGAEEAIINDKTGYVIKAQNYEEIASKINLILSKGSIKKEDCLKWAEENSIENKIKEIINFYEVV